MYGTTYATESADQAPPSPDPYQSPASEIVAEPPVTGIRIPDSVVGHFASVRPWTRACSIVGFLIGIGLTLASFTLTLHTFGQASVQDLLQETPPLFVGQLLVNTLLAFSVALLAFVATAQLWDFSSSIDQLCESIDSADLEVTTFLHQRFWKTTGITTFVMLLWMISFVLIQISS